MKLFKQALLAASVCLALSVQAQTQDYSFGTGDLNGWTAGGGTGTQTGPYMQSGIGVSTTSGAQTIACCGSNTWVINPYTGSHMVGMQPGGQQNYSQMTSALGLSSTSISALNSEVASQGGGITSAAWISKDFTFSAPTTFKMAWVYTSTDYVPFNDGSIATMVNTGSATTFGKVNNVLGQYALLGATNPGTGNYSTGSYGSTGWQLAQFDVLTAGTYKVGFGIFNQGDTALSPVLQVNDAIGTVTQNGELFGAVAPNPGSVAPPVDSTPTPPAPPPAPTLVSTANGTPIVTSSVADGTTVTTVSISNGATNNVAVATLGATAVATAVTNTRSGQTTQNLNINQNTTVTRTTPVTTVTTSTTPVTTVTTSTTPRTTTTVTTPTLIDTYSDGSTVTRNDTPVTTTEVIDIVTTSTAVVEEVVTTTAHSNNVEVSSADAGYSTRIDQYTQLSNINKIMNYSLDSGVLDRNRVLGNGFNVSERNSFYLTGSASESSTANGYSYKSTTYGLGYDWQVAKDWIVGAQFNRGQATLSGASGTYAGGNLNKDHVGIYSAYTVNDWILKNDVGYAANTFNNSHSIPELGMSNTGSTKGQDLWATARVYTPEWNDIRPFVGVRSETNRRNGVTESGTALTAMTYGAVNTNKTSTDLGVRYDAVVAQDWRVIGEYAYNSQNFNTAYASIGYAIDPASVVRLRYGYGKQYNYTVQSAMIEARFHF
jgi:hypothetical protein